MSKPFQCKQFTVYQDKTAMKIGTDALLLGAWVSVPNFCDTILDIGAGTGIISLMMAQRSEAMTIDSVEIDEAAYEQTVENFERSDWGDRLFCYHTDFLSFADEISEEEETYDLIISNPPFFTEDFQTEDIARNKARFTSSLSFETLLHGVQKIIAPKGIFAVIIPFKEKESFVKTAEKNGLFLCKYCEVKGNPTSPTKRIMMELSTSKVAIIESEELIIEIERHQYTDAYIKLTKDFYLKM